MFPDDKLKAVMASMLDIDVSTVGPATSTDTVDQWDSVLHMNLIIALEEAFEISVPDDEVATLTSYPIVRAMLEEQLAGG
jgi:acyl carrier protein